MKKRHTRFLDKATAVAAWHFNLSPSQVRSRGRTEQQVFCRWFIWRLGREYGFINEQLGRYFDRDTSTVSEGVNQLAFMLDCYPEWREEWNIFYGKMKKHMKTTYLTRKQTADRLAVSDRSVDRWIGSGRLHAVRVGRSVRISERSVDKLIADCTVAAG